MSTVTINAVAHSHALDAENIATVAVSFINDNISPISHSLVELANFDSTDVGALRIRMTLIWELAKIGRYLVEDAACCLEVERDELKAKANALKDGAA